MRLSIPTFRKRKAPPLLGIDLGSSGVKVVELSPGLKAAMRLQRYAIEPVEEGAITDGNIERPEPVAEALGKALRRLGTRTRDAALAMPSSAVITKRIILPAGLSDEDYEFQVESEASQYVPFAIEEVSLDFQILGPTANDPSEVDVLLAALHVGPRLSRVESVTVRDLPPAHANAFVIAPSTDAVGTTSIPPDTAVCDDCLAEMRDPGDRRFGYGDAFFEVE